MIRNATKKDIPEILAHARFMHAESRYRVLPWDGDKVAGLIDWLIDNPDGLAIVFEDNERIVGGMLAVIEPHFCSTAMVAQEYGVFVDKSHRGSLLGVRLFHHYTAWAQAKGAALIQVGLSTGIHHDKAAGLLRSLSYREVGQLYEFEEHVSDE